MTERVAVITGGLGVLGTAVARLATAKGMTVAVIDSKPAPVGHAAGLLLDCVDLTNATAAREALETVVSQLGRIDALMNVAGAFRWTTLEESGADDWEQLFRINVQTAANATRAAIPALKSSGAGRVVNVGAGAAERASAGMGPYAAAKCGVHRLTESLAE